MRDEIKRRCEQASPYQFETIAEQVARATLGDDWEWHILVSFGGAPHYPVVVITRYLSTEPLHDPVS